MTTTGDLTDSQHLVRVFPDARPGEPVFVLLGNDGSLNVVTLAYVRFVGREMNDGRLLPSQAFRELRVLLPEAQRTQGCMLTIGEVDGIRTLEIVGSGSSSGVLWHCPLND